MPKKQSNKQPQKGGTTPEEHNASIFSIIMNDMYIRLELFKYFKRLVQFARVIHNDQTTQQIYLKFAAPVTSCGGLDPMCIANMDTFEEGHFYINDTFMTSTEADANHVPNTRELLTAIMMYSFNCCQDVWQVIRFVSLHDKADAKSKKANIEKYKQMLTNLKTELKCNTLSDLATYGIDLAVIRARIEDIEQKYSMPAYMLYEKAQKDSKINHGPYPNFCHLATTSTSVSLAIAKTTSIDKIYTRNRGKKWIYEWILKGQDYRLTPAHIAPPLSIREQHYIQYSVSNKPADNFDFFLDNVFDASNQLSRLPWSTGFMVSRVDPDNVFVKRAHELKRYVILSASGSMEGMLNVAEIFGFDLKIMTLAAMSWMYIARDHALYEMMIIANDIIGEKVFKFPPNNDLQAALKYDRQQVVNLYNKAVPMYPKRVATTDDTKSQKLIQEEEYLKYINGMIPIPQQGGFKPPSPPIYIPEDQEDYLLQELNKLIKYHKCEDIYPNNYSTCGILKTLSLQGKSKKTPRGVSSEYSSSLGSQTPRSSIYSTPPATPLIFPSQTPQTPKSITPATPIINSILEQQKTYFKVQGTSYKNLISDGKLALLTSSSPRGFTPPTTMTAYDYFPFNYTHNPYPIHPVFTGDLDDLEGYYEYHKKQLETISADTEYTQRIEKNIIKPPLQNTTLPPASQPPNTNAAPTDPFNRNRPDMTQFSKEKNPLSTNFFK